jgi:class 3 adenylate cyclase
MSSVVEIYNGYVLKYVGDAVIAFFALGLIDTLHMTKQLGVQNG